MPAEQTKEVLHQRPDMIVNKRVIDIDYHPFGK